MFDCVRNPTLVSMAGAFQSPASRVRIVIADDHELVRDGIASILRDRGDICGEAANGAEAALKAQELKPDLVLLDLSMPVMSGTVAAKLIRKVSPSTKIIFISMHDSPTVIDLVRVAGADGFVSKHSRAEDFRRTVARLSGLPPSATAAVT